MYDIVCVCVCVLARIQKVSLPCGYTTGQQERQVPQVEHGVLVVSDVLVYVGQPEEDAALMQLIAVMEDVGERLDGVRDERRLPLDRTVFGLVTNVMVRAGLGAEGHLAHQTRLVGAHQKHAAVMLNVAVLIVALEIGGSGVDVPPDCGGVDEVERQGSVADVRLLLARGSVSTVAVPDHADLDIDRQ